MDRIAFYGAVYMIDLGDPRGCTQGGKRPCVVVSNDRNNIYSPTINVIPLTSKNKTTLPVHCILDSERYPFLWGDNNVAMTEQIVTVDKTAVMRFLGRLEEEDMSRIIECLQIQLSMER